jgi:hypothetical protein
MAMERVLDPATPALRALTPAIGFGAGKVMRKKGPGIIIGTIILTHCAPRALGDVGASVVPGAYRARKRFQETLVLWRDNVLRRRHGGAPVVCLSRVDISLPSASDANTDRPSSQMILYTVLGRHGLLRVKLPDSCTHSPCGRTEA